MGKRLVWMLMVLVALFAIGCGAAAPGKAASPMEPGMGGMAMDRDGDGIADQSDKEEGNLYRAQPDEAPAREMHGGAVAQMQPPQKAGAPPPVQKPAPDAAGEPAPQPTGVETGAEPQLAGPLLIYTANVHMAVFEARKALDKAEQISKGLGGYLVRRDDASITVRIPAAKFDGALAKLLELGDVLHRDVSVRDVTAEYFDMQVRLKNAEAVRDRLQELLKKSANVTEAIQVERELARVTAELESMKGRLKLMRELILFSTITLRFQARPVESIDNKVRLPFPWLDQLGLPNLLRL